MSSSYIGRRLLNSMEYFRGSQDKTRGSQFGFRRLEPYDAMEPYSYLFHIIFSKYQKCQ